MEVKCWWREVVDLGTILEHGHTGFEATSLRQERVKEVE